MTPPDPPKPEAPGGAGDEDRSREPEQSLPPMDFSTFILSLASSAAVNLGQVPPPGAEKTQVDLRAAKQIIDILGVIEEKTRGNLDASEQKLLQSILYDLRVQYVDACKAQE